MKLSILIFLLLSAFSLLAQNPTFPPTHELDKDSSLTTFIVNLKKAVDQKDVDYLVSVMDKKVNGGLDSEGGIDEFIQLWELREDSSYFWGYISRALELSGAFVNDPKDETGRYQVVYPYLYNFEPAMDDDYFALGVITGKNVNLRDRPDTKANVKTKLTHDVIWYIYEDPSGATQYGKNAFGDPEWYLIETYDHQRKGWVFWKYVYPTVGPRLFLYQNKAGKWLISAFIAGD